MTWAYGPRRMVATVKKCSGETCVLMNTGTGRRINDGRKARAASRRRDGAEVTAWESCTPVLHQTVVADSQ